MRHYALMLLPEQRRSLSEHGRSHQVFRLPRYCWLFIWRFPIAAECTDPELLQAMVCSKDYQYSYIAPWPHPTQSDRPVHGPFWVSDLGPSSYLPVDRVAARTMVVSFLAALDPPMRIEDLRLDDLSEPALEETSTYRLDQARLTPINPAIAGILVEFDEHVVIDRRRRLLIEVVVGSD
jgi:hypothetical protein